MKRYNLLSLLVLLFTFAVIGCKKEAEPTPRASFTIFTQITSKFDRLDVYVDKKLVGSLTATSSTYPDCGANPSASVVTIPVEPGARDIMVKQLVGAKEVGIWDDWTINFKDGECIRRRLTE